ncbi:MAG: TraR/DksA C4-type zinc finger protein [Bacteroidia bacterium]
MTEKVFYTKEELKEFEVLINEKLDQAKAEYNRCAESLREDNDGSADTFNFTEFGNDNRDKEQLEYNMQRQKKFIINLENALARIKNGTYGICKVTGKLIPKERLRIVPHTTTSMEGKRILGQ